MKVTTLATLLGTLIGSATLSSVATAQDLPELDRQLTIMSGVIETALKQDTRKDKVRFRGIESTYLAKQGVVFTIRTGGMSRVFDFDFGEFLSVIPGAPPAPPAPSVTVVADGVHVETDGDYDVVFGSSISIWTHGARSWLLCCRYKFRRPKFRPYPVRNCQ